MLSVFASDFDPTFGFWRALPELQRQPDATALAYDLDEAEDHYTLSFDVPGVARDDLSIEVKGNELTVAGERKTGRRGGKFQRTFSLPDGVTAEHVAADLKDGVLQVAIRKPTAAKPTRIAIGDGGLEKLAKAN